MDRNKRWEPEVIDQAIPLLPETPTANAEDHRNGDGTGCAVEPPVRLDDRQQRVWEGVEFKAKEDGGVDRSASLLRIGRELYNAGATRWPTVAALAERDETLGWEKFTGRPDGRERYHEIFDELQGNGLSGAVAVGRGSTAYEEPIPEPLPWPVLAEEAYHGLPGDVVRAIGPHTEADPVAVLGNLLCFFGNAVGRRAWFQVGADRHHLKLNVALVGATSKGRKGMSEGHVRELMGGVDRPWLEDRIANGLSSGEGLIHEVRDPVWGLDADGNTVLKDAGADDKRLLVSEPELARVLKVMGREANTLSPIIRQCWDGGRLRVMTRTNALKSTDSHVSLVGHISRDELLRHLSETEAASGFANRFVFLLVRRSKVLPFGGEWHTVDTSLLVERLSKALSFAETAGEITWGESAKDAWRAVYGPLSEGKPGLFGAVVGRAEAQVVRLACLYAVMDSSRTIESEHLEAASALWSFAEESARHIFGDATGDPVADAILEALKDASDGGLTRTEIRDLFGRNKNADRINQALASLFGLDRVRRETLKTGGRPSEKWYVNA